MKEECLIMKKKMAAALIVCLTLAESLAPMAVNASTVHYNDATKVTSDASFSDWSTEWNKVSADYTKVSMTPGADETKLNFAWMTKKDSKNAATPMVLFGTSKKNLKKFTGTVENADSKLTGGVQYVSNKVTVTGLKANTKYYYTVVKNGKEAPVRSYTTGSFDDIKLLYVGDPQIGASKGQPQGSEKLTAADGAANTAARNDAYEWDRTLKIASGLNKDLNFIISAGDQVNKTGKAKEEEFAGYLNASLLQYMPVATTIGNHDSLTSDYKAHFNVPNATNNGATQAGGDYYYSYGDALFIVLNTNNYNVAEHEKTMQQAVASDPNAKWKIVTIHQDIYGSGLDHSDTDGMILRTQLTPIFDKYDVDVVLQGHDHTYSRSKLLYGDGQTHDSYEFQLNAAGDDYDWDHAHDTTKDQQIALYPEDGDKAAKAALDQFTKDNHCYTIEDVKGNTVTDPQGTLYMTANSASGSKYYELATTQQDYIAERSQNWLPSYSVIEITDSKFAIDTYQILDNGAVEKIDDTFTIQKTK